MERCWELRGGREGAYLSLWKEHGTYSVCIDSPEVDFLLHVEQMTGYYSPLTPRYVGKEYRKTRREIARVPHELSFIHFVLRGWNVCVCACKYTRLSVYTCVRRWLWALHLIGCIIHICMHTSISPTILDAGFYQLNRFTWPVSDKPAQQSRIPLIYFPFLFTHSILVLGAYFSLVTDSLTN